MENVEEVSNPAIKKPRRMSIPIAFKLIAMVVVILLAAASFISISSTERLTENSTQRERDANRDQAKTRAIALETQLSNIINDMKTIGNALGTTQANTPERDSAVKMTFEKSKDIVNFELIQKYSDGSLRKVEQLVNDDYLKENDLDRNYLKQIRQVIAFPIETVFASTETAPVFEIRNSSTKNGIPLMTLGIPYSQDETGTVTHIAVADLRLDQFQKIFTVSERTIFAVDKVGSILAHPDDSMTISRKRMEKSPIVQKALTSNLLQGAQKFDDPYSGEVMIGAYAKTTFGISVISQAPERVLLEDAALIRHEAISITAMVLSGALFFVIVFAGFLTSPIERLEEVAQEIARGNFNVKTEVKTRDEVGQLAETIDDMVEGLIERDKAKTLINKFHGSTVAEDMMAGEIELKGERKDVTVFFSDIRDFTKFSEGHSPEEVVAMLNEYFHVMVDIINRNNGMVDKFIGDAIMAVWGTQSDGFDEANAIKACLEMRMALEKLNDDRLARGLTEIKIGIGIHSGTAISGTIGSDERMEYTVIGDAVNMAARIEASTKAFGTDLLLSEDSFNLVQEQFWAEMAGQVEVKGKSSALKLYKVNGVIENGEKIEYKTRYSEYAKGQDAKVNVA